MLTLTRFAKESVMIGDNIEITILRVAGNGRVKIGITAPKVIPVHRKEVWVTIQKEKEKGEPNGTVTDLPDSTY